MERENDIKRFQEVKNELVDFAENVLADESACNADVTVALDALRLAIEIHGEFKVGDCIEISGKQKLKVIFADSEKFIAAKIQYSHGIGNILTNDIKIYSNEQKGLKEKYWVRRIEPIECYYSPFDEL